jgi:hypothetical protein
MAEGQHTSELEMKKKRNEKKRQKQKRLTKRAHASVSVKSTAQVALLMNKTRGVFVR